MLVSIIIPTYNEESVILDCIESLNRQTLKDFELIIVDDGSTDSTLKLLKQIKSSSLKVLTQNHLGAGAARNKGASKAIGKILVFVDADMTFDKDFLKNLIEPIGKKGIIGTFSKEEYVKNWDNIWARCLNIEEGWEKGKRHPKNYPDKQWVYRAILKSKFDEVGGYDPGGYTDDWSLGKKVGKMAVSARDAKFFHKNPDNLKEIFVHARWIAKRQYKFGKFGELIALLRATLPISLIVGFFKSIFFLTPQFIIFKIVYDLGIFLGIINYSFTKKGAK